MFAEVFGLASHWDGFIVSAAIGAVFVTGLLWWLISTRDFDMKGF